MILVLADDFSGAAEVAGAAHAMGLRAEVQIDMRESSADCIVLDTNTRSQSAEHAQACIAKLLPQVRHCAPEWIYKKTDSVLRGPVAAELRAILQQCPFQRSLLVPANPARGRTVVHGVILISGIPVAQTPFAVDPEHPARSSSAIDLLGIDGEGAVISPADSFPDAQFVVGNTGSTVDLEHWASRVDDHTLPSGGVEFFEAVLRRRQTHTRRSQTVSAPSTESSSTLLVCGSSAAWGERLKRLQQKEIPLVDMAKIGVDRSATDAELELMKTETLGQLSAHKVVAIAVSSERLREANCINHGAPNLAQLVVRVLQSGCIDEIFVEGGATASAIVRACNWPTMSVVECIAPGIVSLLAHNEGCPVMTVKPGSYAWPDSVWARLQNVSRTANSQ